MSRLARSRATALARPGLDIAWARPTLDMAFEGADCDFECFPSIPTRPRPLLGQIANGDLNLDTRHGIYRDGA